MKLRDRVGTIIQDDDFAVLFAKALLAELG